MSGIDYDKGSNTYYTISDDRSPTARFYSLDLNYDINGFTEVNFTGVTTLKDIGNLPFASASLDPESIRFNAARNSLFWTSERDQNGDPWIREMNLDGTHKKDSTTTS